MKRYNSLNEEINRMKSLFTEERMFGNLIKEQTSNKEVPTKLMNCDEVEAYDTSGDSEKWKTEKVTGLVKTCENGKATGVWMSKNGVSDGVYRDWFENGQLYFETNWKDGKLDGVYRRWYENGQLEIESRWKDGKWDGRRLEFNENGDVETEEYYINGKEISKEEYEKQHKIDKLPSKEIGSTEGGEPVERGMVGGELNLTEKQCVDFVRDSFKMIRKSGDPTEWKKKYTKGEEALQWCYSNYNKKLTKDGLFGPGNKTNELFSILKLEFPEVVDGGEEQKWYNKIIDSFDIKKATPVRRDGGAIIFYLKNLEGNKYRFRSGVGGFPLIDVAYSKGKNKYLKKDIIALIKKQLNLGDDSKITVINGINTRGFDVGTFIIS